MIIRFAAFLLLLYAIGFVMFAVTLPRAADGQVTDGIVVLTGGPGRIERGVAMLAQDRARRLLVSGVDRRVKPAELAVEYRIPARLIGCCIDLGHESVDTRSNADETAAWLRRLRYRSIRLVTTDWHMPRARFEIERALPGTTILADPVPSEPGLIVLLREYSKYLLRRGAAIAGV